MTFLTKNMFNVFYSFLAGLSLKLAKSANFSKKNSAQFYYGYHQTKNSMLISHPLKKIRNSHPQKIAGRKFLHTAIKVKKYFFYHFCTDLKSISNSVFSDNHIEIWQNNALLILALFAKFEATRTRGSLKKKKNVFRKES